MKKIALLLMTSILACHSIFAQTALFKPGPATGVDAVVLRNDICTWWDNANGGTSPENPATAWTYYGHSCGPGVVRTLIRFDDLNTLPAGATITFAELRLFGVPISTNYGNSQYPGSPYIPGNNNGWIRRVTAPWTEMGVTWNTQPTITTVNQVATPGSNSRWNFNIAVNVTNQVIAMMVPGQNNGFMLMLDNENFYRSVLFASSDHADSLLWPELYVEYSLPCDANFTWCNSTTAPGTYNFTVNNVSPGYVYNWTFGDGGTAAGTTVTHTYVTGGTFTICLTAYNPNTGDSCKTCTTICFGNQDGCTINFEEQPSPQVGNSFIAIPESGQTIVSYLWDFGDGSTSTAGPSVFHHYATPGMYLVCLTVIYANGCTAKICRKIIVQNLSLDKQSVQHISLAQVPEGDLLPVKAANIKPVTAIKVSPNPVNTNSISVSVNGGIIGTFRYTIFNEKGEQSATGRKSFRSGEQVMELDVKSLRPGKYWVELYNNQHQLRAGFVKL